MYIPPSFLETGPAKLHDFMEQHSFATLISSHEGEPVASHLPLLLDREAKPHGWLIGHMARANLHWQTAGTFSRDSQLDQTISRHYTALVH